MKKQVIAYLHTHWDREWYVTFQEFRYKLVKMIDGLIDTLENNKIDVFDATKEFEFEFSYSGTQAVKNRLVIRKNDDYSIVYDQTEERLKLTHTLPANTLANNTTYVVQVQVFDVDGNQSTLSEAQNFSCHSTPSLVFTDITDGEMRTTANLKSEITFTQNEGDSIKEREFLLYDNNKANIYSSNMYYDDFSNHVYYGLENLTNYYIRAIGSTVYGFTIDTGYIGIVVKYKTIVTNMSANIVPKNGQFFIDANIVAIDYDVKNNNYKIVNGEAIIGSDNVVTYNINHVDDDHTIIIRAKDIYDTCFCNILYDEAKVDISLLSISNIRYCKLKATEDNSIYVIYKELTDSSATHTKDSIINFEIHRINGIFSLKAYYA